MQNIDMNKAVEWIRKEVIDYFETDPDRLMDHTGEINHETIYEFIEQVAERDGAELELNDDELEHFIDQVFDEIGIDDLCNGLERDAREILQDQWEYGRNPLKYHGLKQSDFL